MRHDFDRAADELQEWRERQKAGLKPWERAQYERIAQAFERQRQDRMRRFQFERFERVEREKRALLLPRPDASLRMGAQKPMRESRAEFLAQELVHRRHRLELAQIDQEAQRRLDAFLHGAEMQKRGIVHVFRAVQKDRERER